MRRGTQCALVIGIVLWTVAAHAGTVTVQVGPNSTTSFVPPRNGPPPVTRCTGSGPRRPRSIR